MRHSSFRLTVRPSRALALAMLAAHLLAAVLVIVATIALLWKVVLVLAVGVSLAYRRRFQVPTNFSFRPDGSVEFLALVNHASVGAGDTPSDFAPISDIKILDVAGSSRFIGPLMVVRFRRASIKTALVLLPDSFFHIDDYRRLRVWLKWQGKGVSQHHDLQSVLRM